MLFCKVLKRIFSSWFNVYNTKSDHLSLIRASIFLIGQSGASSSIISFLFIVVESTVTAQK